MDTNNYKQKGVSLIITFFIMIIILSVVLSISILLYGEVKVIRNMSNSVSSIFAADSGIEKVLYYDRQVIPSNDKACTYSSDCTSSPYTSCINNFCVMPIQRGLCTMFDSVNNLKEYCRVDNYGGNPDKEHSIYCNNQNKQVIDPSKHPDGCDPDVCDDCQITFDTNIDTKDRTYSVAAQVYPVACSFVTDCPTGQKCTNGSCTDTSVFKVTSKGVFGGTQRQIQIVITPKP